MLQQINPNTGITEILVDARNYQVMIPFIMDTLDIMNSTLVGFDIETEDSRRHDGLNKFMVINPKADKYKKPKKLVFDINRTTITGFSLYLEGDAYDYYFNMAHADIENRLSYDVIKPLLDKINLTKTWVIHNAAFEFVMCKKSWDFDFSENVICSMQFCVTAYNNDEYDIQKFKNSDLLGITKLIPEISRVFAGYDGKGQLSTQQNELIKKVLPKQSEPEHSYNGFVKALSYGYGLKKAVKSWFGYEQMAFVDCLQGKVHMGKLTGEEVLHYGADDAYWCVKLYLRVLQFVNQTNPQALRVFFEQENPMPRIWAECQMRGLRLNYDQIEFRKQEARSNFAQVIREFISALRDFEFSEEPSARLVDKQHKWYVGSSDAEPKYSIYRERFKALMATNVDELSDFEVSQLVSGSVPENWAKDTKTKKNPDAGNITHYMMARVLYHDLLDLPLIYVKGQVQSGEDARGSLRDKILLFSSDPQAWIKEFTRYKMHSDLTDQQRLELAEEKVRSYPKDSALKIMSTLSKMAGIEQTMKLYLNPYLMLVDPETHRVHPTISSLLNTRRMGGENPNPMQLSKRGETTFVRGFFLPERDDHLIVSVDWSQVELVLIGEESKDPAFFSCYGSIPYNDLHLGAAASALRVYYPDLSNEQVKDVGKLTEPEVITFKTQYPKVFINPIKNEEMPVEDVLKFWRGNAGKVSNFGYWYSGSLMTVQPKLNWTDKEMWTATDNYRQQFPIAESWRVRTQDDGKMYGFVYIFDGLRRTRYESTNDWYNTMVAKFSAYNCPAVTAFGQRVCRTIQRRSGNQLVNAKIQGGCATLAKRSIKRLRDEIVAETSIWDACFLLPIHDELVFSVRWDQAIAFSERIKEVMCNHPDLVKWLKLDGTISVGKTLEPYHPKKARFGQIELDEAPILEGYLPKGTHKQKLSYVERCNVVNYLMNLPPIRPNNDDKGDEPRIL